MTWRDEAACLQVVKEAPEFATAWDNIDHGDHYEPDYLESAAKKICSECPVRRMCVESATLEPEADGLRGGYRFHMGFVSRAEATKIQREFGIKAKVRRGGRLHDVEDFNMQEVRQDD